MDHSAATARTIDLEPVQRLPSAGRRDARPPSAELERLRARLAQAEPALEAERRAGAEMRSLLRRFLEVRERERQEHLRRESELEERLRQLAEQAEQRISK